MKAKYYVSGTAVIESRQEDNVQITCKSETEARRLSRHLNGGGGFNGWTPNFLVADSRPDIPARLGLTPEG